MVYSMKKLGIRSKQAGSRGGEGSRGNKGMI
jgi:hypothetical protein